MSDEKPTEKPATESKAVKFETRDWIYGGVMVVGFVLIVDGFNGVLDLGLPENAATVIGAVIGAAAAYGLAWARKK